jgi:GntR family transcriptional regulator
MSDPLYRVVIDAVVARIAAGQLLPGAMLPSETHLAAEIGVSQGTARKALMMLEQYGIVRREQGRGTFVTARTPDSSLFNFFRLRKPDGTLIRPDLTHESILIRAADAVERDTLEGRPDEVFEISRVRSLQGVPSTAEVSVVPVNLFPGLDRRAPLPNTLYVLYQQIYGCIILRAEESIVATAASPGDAALLDVPEGTPLLCVDRIAKDVLGRVVERRRSHCRTDQMTYMVTLS